MFDSGFYRLISITEGRYLGLRRDGQHSVYNPSIVSVDLDNRYQIDLVKVYQVPNLLEEFESKVKLTKDTSRARSSDETAMNVLTHLDNRTCANDLPPLKNAAGDPAAHKSCFMSSHAELQAGG